MNPSLDRLARDISSQIDEELQRSGILYRIFSRAKTENSILKKLKLKKYESSDKHKLMQDVIGIRITLYFEDDVSIVYNVLKRKFIYLDETVDEADVSVFAPSRINLIFKMNDDQANEIVDIVISKFNYIDTTYEVQLRTVLSEGWHEVEHDLRYKCQEDWAEHNDLSHILNGVYATLVTCDWSMNSIFEKLAYRHYKVKNWPAMVLNKFKIRIKEGELDSRIVDILNNDDQLSKELFRINRNEFIERLFLDSIRIPLTLSNILFILNAYYLHNSEIESLAPDFILSNKKLYNLH